MVFTDLLGAWQESYEDEIRKPLQFKKIAKILVIYFT